MIHTMDPYQNNYTQNKTIETVLTVILNDIYSITKQINNIAMVLSPAFDIFDNHIMSYCKRQFYIKT